MYGGLFGDLPAAKKKGSSASQQLIHSSASTTTTTTTVAAAASSTDAVPSASGGTTLPPTTTKTVMGGDAMTKLATGPTTQWQPQQQQPSILQTVGQAGTSMAFVPTAAMKRKKPHRLAAKSVDEPRAKKMMSLATAEEEGNAKDATESMSTTPTLPSEQPSLRNHEMSLTTVTTTIVRTKQQQQPLKSQSGNMDIHRGDPTNDFVITTERNDHAPQNMDDNGNGNTDSFVNPATTLPLDHHRHYYATEDNTSTTSASASAIEITDPYDPFMPNDLLQYWEMQAATEERERIEQETREALENQRLLRERLERERQELLKQQQQQQHRNHDQASGDSGASVVVVGRGGADAPAVVESSYDSIRMEMMGRGRGGGRGRGVSNLPAWLIEQQRREAEALEGGDLGGGG
jgi:hypothetical protein